VRDVIERIYLKERAASWAEQAKEAFTNRRNFYFGGIPIVKFWTHQVFYIAYMLLPFLFLTHDFVGRGRPHGVIENIAREDGMGMPDGISHMELLFWVWSLCRLLDELVQLAAAPRFWSYFRNVWNQIDMATHLLILVNLCLRLSCHPHLLEQSASPVAVRVEMHPEMCVVMQRYARTIYAVVTVLIWCRMVQVLRIDYQIGKLSIILGEMMGTDVAVFLKMQIFISFGFGAAFCILQPIVNPPYFYQLVLDMSSPLWMPIWGLMGDFDLGSMLENTGSDHISADSPAFFVLPSLLLIYMFMTTVVLINLLIAQMSSTYEEMNEVAIDEWHYARAGLVEEYMLDKTWLPPPLNLLTHTANATSWVLRLLHLSAHPSDCERAGFALLMDSAQQLEVRRIEREAAQTVVALSRSDTAATTEAVPPKVAERFDLLEAKLARVLDKLDVLSKTGSPRARRSSRLVDDGEAGREVTNGGL